MSPDVRTAEKRYKAKPPASRPAAAARLPEKEGPGAPEEHPLGLAHGRIFAVLAHVGPIVLVCAIPLVVVSLVDTNGTLRYVSSDAGLVLAGGWTIFSFWIIIDKGVSGILRGEASGGIWMLLGLLNLIAALATFFLAGH